MIAVALLLLADVGQELPLGAFKIGEWRGFCRRDGFLAGSEEEYCEAERAGRVQIDLKRSPRGMTITATVRGCSTRGVTQHRTVSQKRLLATAQGRAVLVRGVIDQAVHGAVRACPGATAPRVIAIGDLKAVLKETDGLVVLPPEARESD